MLFFCPMARVSLGFVKSHEFWAPRRRISIWTDLEFHLWSYWTHRTQRIHFGSIYTRASNNDQILTHLIVSIQIHISHLISRCKSLPECEIHQVQEYGMSSGIQQKKIWIGIWNAECERAMSGLRFGMWNVKVL